MALALYMDHHVPRAITIGLRLRGVEVLTAYEDGTSELDDGPLLDRADELGRILFTWTWHSQDALIRSIWNIRPDEQHPRLVTCYPLKEENHDR